jgi:hypothetical protein
MGRMKERKKGRNEERKDKRKTLRVKR